MIPNRIFPKNPKNRQRLRLLVGFLASVFTVYTASSITQSLFVIETLESAGATVPLKMWPSILWHDWVAMTLHSSVREFDVYYAPIIFLGFLVALPSAALTKKFSGWSAWLLYPLAGAVAMATILYLVNLTFYNLPFYSGTRGTAGCITQLLVGALGGAVFVLFTRVSQNSLTEDSVGGRQ